MQPADLLAEAQAAVQQGDTARAVDLASQVASAAGADVRALIAAGDVLSDLGSHRHAETAYDLAARAVPNHPAILRRLALALFDQEKYGDAEAAFARASNLEPGHAKNWNNLGLAQLRQNKHGAAAASFQRAVALDPRYALAFANLGKALFLKRDGGAARQALKRAVDLGTTMSDAYALLASLVRQDGDNAAAMSLLRKATDLDPANANYRLDLGQLEVETGDVEAGRKQFAAALEHQPNNLKARLGLALSLPQIYPSEEALGRERAQYTINLTGLLADSDRFLANPRDELIDHIQVSNFFLAYQGRDDRDLQRDYAHFCGKILDHCVPQHRQPVARRVNGDQRVRVGFLSHFFFEHTAGKYFESWVTQLDAARFETFVYGTSSVNDATTKAIAAKAHRFQHLVDVPFPEMADRIKADRLDVLVYPELGMRSSNFALASLRLAPVQCMGWGHPVTSGHDSIDYYLSCEAMEPADAALHYTEKLHLLPGLGTCYAKPTTPVTKARADYGLPESCALLLVPQSLFKIHPANDVLVARTLAAIPNARAVFFSGFGSDLNAQFRRRLESEFAKHGLEWDQRVIVLPRTSRADYLRINALCDLMLDTLLWSGGNTSLDALASGLPVVTLPGPLMRARQTAGMLRLMGCEDMIARDADHYVELAVALSRPDRRAEASARILAAADRLFDRLEPIRALEDFLESAARPHPENARS